MRLRDLIAESHDRAASCVLSGCGRYRYTLRIPLAADAPRGACLFVMANPSAAIVLDGEFKSDPTVTRCINFARAWGFGELIVENARAWRETDPKKVPADPLAIGPENDERIRESAREAELVICGWGKLGGSRGLDVLEILRDVSEPFALGLNNDGSPKHPLYLPSAARPVELGGSRIWSGLESGASP
jgi:hypothetical protein